MSTTPNTGTSKIVKIFVANLKRIMSAENISMTELAEMAGVSQGGISDFLMLKHDNPSLEYAEKLAVALGYPLPALLVDRDFPSLSVMDSKNTQCVVAVLPKHRAMLAKLWNYEFIPEVDKLQHVYINQKKSNNQ